MKFLLQSRIILSAIFLLLGVASVVFISVASLNYIQLYPATSQLTGLVSRVVFLNNPSGQIIARIVVNNTVDYSGLTVTSESLSLYFFSASNTSDTLFKDRPLSDASNSIRQVSPSSNTTWEWTLSIPPANITSLGSFYNAHNKNVVVHYSLLLNIATFLAGEGGTVSLQREDKLPLLSS